MTHQMKNLCVFSLFHCVEGGFDAASGGTPKMKIGAPRDELRNGRGRGWAVADVRQATPNPIDGTKKQQCQILQLLAFDINKLQVTIEK